MLGFDNEVVTLPTPSVRDNMKFQSIRFGVYEPTGESFAELRCWSTSLEDSDLPGEDSRLRLYESADKFLDDFCADPEAATKAWAQAQTNEEPRPPVKKEESE